MELDELKDQLKNKLAADHSGRSDSDIAALLNKRTVSVVGKIKKSLRIEILFGSVFVLLFALFGIFSGNHALSVYFSVFTIVCAACVLLLTYLLLRTARLGGTALPVKSNLQTIVKIIEEYMKRVFQFTMAMIPVCFIFSFVLGYLDSKPPTQAEKFSNVFFTKRWEVNVFLVVYVIGFTIGMYYFSKWFLRKMYGKYVAQLKECINELSEE
ncbi:MAG: hypothetical protein JWQ30_2180 [Sediminibacterium sp.]|nr:hypothetical protein [Sediminibacterium sp.]